MDMQQRLLLHADQTKSNPRPPRGWLSFHHSSLARRWFLKVLVVELFSTLFGVIGLFFFFTSSSSFSAPWSKLRLFRFPRWRNLWHCQSEGSGAFMLIPTGARTLSVLQDIRHFSLVLSQCADSDLYINQLDWVVSRVSIHLSAEIDWIGWILFPCELIGY